MHNMNLIVNINTSVILKLCELFFVCIFSIWTVGVSPPSPHPRRPKWRSHGETQLGQRWFTSVYLWKKSQVRHRFTRYTYTLTDEDKQGLLNIKQVKIVQNYSETSVCLKEIGKKWTFNMGGIFRNQSVPLVSPTEAPSRRRMPNKKSASLVAIEDKN